MEKSLYLFLIVVCLLPTVLFAQEGRDSISSIGFDSTRITPRIGDAFNLEYPKRLLSTNLPPMSLLEEWKTSDSTYLVKFSEEDLFEYNFYLQDYRVSGPLWHDNKRAIIGSGSFTSLPFLGAMSTANISYFQQINNNFQYSVGVDAYKYAFGHSTGNNFGMSGSMRYRLNDNLALNAFGTYYLENPFHSMSTLAYLPSSYYGASMSWDITEGFGADLGAQRYFDSSSGRWEFAPIVMPYINMNGTKIGFDFGGFIMQGLESILKRGDQDMQIGHGGNFAPRGAVPPPPMRPGGR